MKRRIAILVVNVVEWFLCRIRGDEDENIGGGDEKTEKNGVGIKFRNFQSEKKSTESYHFLLARYGPVLAENRVLERFLLRA